MDELVVKYIVDQLCQRGETRLQIGVDPDHHAAAVFRGTATRVRTRRRIVDRFNSQVRAMIADHTYHRLLHVNWIRADVDGDGLVEFVPQSDTAGPAEPPSVYRSSPPMSRRRSRAPSPIGGTTSAATSTPNGRVCRTGTSRWTRSGRIPPIRADRRPASSRSAGRARRRSLRIQQPDRARCGAPAGATRDSPRTDGREGCARSRRNTDRDARSVHLKRRGARRAVQHVARIDERLEARPESRSRHDRLERLAGPIGVHRPVRVSRSRAGLTLTRRFLSASTNPTSITGTRMRRVRAQTLPAACRNA